jgi:alpha-glucosidase
MTLCLFLGYSFAFAQKGLITQTLQTVKSPDGKLVCQLYQKLIKKGIKQFLYITYNSTPIILESELDIQLDNHLSELAMALKVDKTTKWCEDMEFLKASSSEVDSVWKPLYGERSVIKNRYSTATLRFKK